MVLSNSNETIPDSVTCRDSAECEFWDKYLQTLRNVKSQESIITFEDDCNNSSFLSNCQMKDNWSEYSDESIDKFSNQLLSI